ncbi:MAG: hypothetical protein D6765_09755 [Bacteroidetes bacterium]|nr:MAG: hypothetical protein D6765_09755 [Bacteroidota bacterium]
MLLQDIVGQDSAKAWVRSTLEAGRLPHALLVVGPEGCGKLPFALALAQLLLCSQPQDGDACGQCPACQKAAKFIHPDLHFSFPTVGSKATSEQFLPQWRQALQEQPLLTDFEWFARLGAENKQGNIPRDECVRIVQRLSLKAFQSPRKVLLLWLPEYLGKEGNRLLKLLEEPPEGTHFLLVSERPDLLLNTIRSRCQLLQLKPLSDEEVADYLTRHAALPPERALPVARLANGNLREALQTAATETNDHAALFQDWLRKAYVGHGVQLMEWVERFAALGRESQKQFHRYALRFCDEYLHLLTCGQTRSGFFGSDETFARNLSKVLKLHHLEAFSRLLSDNLYHIERYANPKILLLDASIQLHHLLKDKPPVASAPRRDATSLKN